MKYDENALLRNARQSVKDEQAARRKQHLVKVHALWDDCYDLLSDYARECIPDQYESDGVTNHETALENVRNKLRRCKSNTRAGFIVWVCKQLTKEKGFHLVADAVQRFDLDISDWIADAALRLVRYADFPEHCKDGALYRVKMGTRSDGAPIVWTVPEQYWEFVKKLWPVSLKQRVNGAYYIAKQISGQTIPAHRLILNCEPMDTVQSASDNFLDWTSLYVRPLNCSGLYDGRNTSWNKDAERPNTVQEEFERRFQSNKALENYGVNSDNTERFVLPQPIPVNNDLAARSMCWGKLGSTGWADPITPASWDRYAPELPSISVERSAKRLRAEQALTDLGL